MGLRSFGVGGTRNREGSSLSDKVNVNPDKAKQSYTDSWESIIPRETYFKAQFKPRPESRKINWLGYRYIFFIFDPGRKNNV